MKSKFISILLAIGLVFSAVTASASDTLVIKVGHGVPETATLHKGFLKFKEVVETRSNGSMRVEIYPNQQLGGDRELTEGLQMNNVDITAVTANNLAPFTPKFFVWDLFFLFQDHEQAYEVLDGEAGKKLLSYLEPIGLKGLGYMENGFRCLTNSKRDVRSISDLGGIKMRVAENPVQICAWKALGANPTPMAWGELFTALQQHTLDGQETSVELIYSQRFYEVQKCLTLTRHIYSPFVFMASLDFYNDLNDEQRSIIDAAVAEAIPYQRTLARNMEAEAIDKIRAAGVTVVDVPADMRLKMRGMLADSAGMVQKRAGEAYDVLMSAVTH